MAPSENPPLKREQVEIYRLLADIRLKFFFAIVVALAFVALTVRLIINPDWPIALTDSVIGWAIKTVITHYFGRPLTWEK
jgi:hypothetical protein